MDLGALASLPSPLPPFPLTPHLIEGGGEAFCAFTPHHRLISGVFVGCVNLKPWMKKRTKRRRRRRTNSSNSSNIGRSRGILDLYIYIYIYPLFRLSMNEWECGGHGGGGAGGIPDGYCYEGIPEFRQLCPMFRPVFDLISLIPDFLADWEMLGRGGGPFYFFYIHFFYLHIHPSIRLFVRPSVRYPSASGEKGSNWLIIFTHASSGCSTLRLPSIVFISFHSIFIRFIPFHLDSGRVYVCVLRREMNGADMYMHPECFSTGLSHSNLLRSGFKQRFIVWSFLQFRLANICFGPFNSLWHHPIVEFLWNTINSERRKKNDLFISDWATMKHQPIKSSTGDNLISLGMKYDWITFTESHLLNRNQLMGDAVIETVTYAAMIYSERIC